MGTQETKNSLAEVVDTKEKAEKFRMDLAFSGMEKLFSEKPVNFFAENALRILNDDQRLELLQLINQHQPEGKKMQDRNSKQYPTAFHTVDIIPFIHYPGNIEQRVYPSTQVLLGQKTKDNGLYCHIGGFVDPTDDSAEQAALRELNEEAKIKINSTGTLIYLGSFKIDDERYRDSEHKIISSLFAIVLTENEAKQAEGGDDIANVKFFDTFDLANSYKEILVKKHHITFERFLKFLERGK